MFKKSLISLAVVSSVVLSGCGGGGSTGQNAGSDNQSDIENPAIDGRVWPLFNPVTSELPIPNDLIFDSVAADGTFRVADTSPPVTTALNVLSGASTLEPIDIKLSGAIDPTSVDGNAFILTIPNDPTSVAPNPNQNVFLIELEYASGDPLQGLSGAEPPTIPLALTAATAGGLAPTDLSGNNQLQAGGVLAGLALAPAYNAKVIQLDGQDVIRINPLKPLNPRKRYVVVITDGVKAVDGQPLRSSPSYETITGTVNNLASPALVPVRALVNGLWEVIATNYFQVTNGSRAAFQLPPLTDANIALSYSFTTSNDEKVLPYLAEPAAWFEDSLTAFLGVSAAEAVVTGKLDLDVDGDVDFFDVKAAVDGAVATFPTPDLVTALSPTFNVAFGSGGCGGLTGKNAIQCTASGLATSFAGLLPTPAARAINLDITTAQDALQVSAVLSTIVSAGQVNVVQGDITIPYYLGVPTPTDGSAIKNTSWKADEVLATALNAAFAPVGLAIPQANPGVTDVVNYIFPFPKKVADQKIPLLVIYPAGDPLDGTTPVVIFQHGITTDRSAVLTFGSALANAAGVAVVAIDHPLHGVAPISTESKLALAGSLLAASDPTLDTEGNRQAVVDGVFSVGALLQIQTGGCPITLSTPPTPAEIATATGVVLSAACGVPAATSLASALSLESTVANGGSTIPGLPMTDFERHFDFTANAAVQAVPMVLTQEATKAAQVGEDGSGSLFINLTNFAGSRDANRESSLDLMNLRASIGNIDMDGAGGADFDATSVVFIGHSLGTITGAPFVASVNQNQINFAGVPATVKTADDVAGAILLTPGAGVTRVLENSPSFSPSILGGLAAAAGLVQGDFNLELFFHTVQATIDSGDPMNFANELKAQGTPLLLQTVVDDKVIPNNAYPAGFGNAFPAPLAGTDPFAALLGAEQTPNVAGAFAPASGEVINTRYLGATHGTPVLPQASTAFGLTVTDASAAAAFGEMVTQSTVFTLTALGAGTAATQVVDDEVVEAP